MTFDPFISVFKLSRAPQVSPSVGVWGFWWGATVWAVALVCFWPAVGSPSRHRCQLCLSGLEAEAAGDEAATWTHDGSGDDGGGCGGGGDRALPPTAGRGSRKMRVRRRKGEEGVEVWGWRAAGSGSSGTPGRCGRGCSPAGSCVWGRAEPPELTREEGGEGCWDWRWRLMGPQGASVAPGPDRVLLPYLPRALQGLLSVGRRRCRVSRCWDASLEPSGWGDFQQEPGGTGVVELRPQCCSGADAGGTGNSFYRRRRFETPSASPDKRRPARRKRHRKMCKCRRRGDERKLTRDKPAMTQEASQNVDWFGKTFIFPTRGNYFTWHYI